MEEIWKDIEEFEGRYQVSNLGNIKSLNYANRGYVQNLVPKENNRGYLWVELRKDGKGKPILIHRLVAEAFIENENNYPIINHKDENPLNNTVDNLEWCDNSYNVVYSLKRKGKYSHKRYISKGKNRKLKGKHIIQKTKDGEFVKEWESLGEINRSTTMSRWSITECCTGNRKTAHGYKWEFA